MKRQCVGWTRWTSLACLLLAMTACSGASLRRPLGRLFGGSATSRPRITAEDLRDYLAGYAARFDASVTVAAEAIGSQTQDPEIQRRTLLWKLRMIPLTSNAAFLREPLEAYVALLALAASQHAYLSVGEGALLFGSYQQIAVDASSNLERGIEHIGATFLSAEQLQRVTQQVDELVRKHPIRGVFVSDSVRQGFADATAPGGQFEWIIDIPLSPFRALQGVDSGAQAIREFNETAQRFTEVAANLPVYLRWNLELLAYDIETHRTVESGLAAFQLLASSAQELSATAKTLPLDLRQEASQLVSQIDASQGEMQRTLDAARAALVEANNAGKTLDPIAVSLDRTSAQLQQAGVAWTAMVQAARGPTPSAGTATDGSHPFDIRDYERTAAQINDAAVQLRALVAEINATSGAPTRGFVDHVAWRAFELGVAFFALLFGYRWIGSRLGRRRIPAA